MAVQVVKVDLVELKDQSGLMEQLIFRLEGVLVRQLAFGLVVVQVEEAVLGVKMVPG